MNTKQTVLATAMAVAFGCAHAQSVQTLEPVVVSAARHEQRLSEVIPSVSVIDRDQIERSQARDLASLLLSEPGFEFGRNGGSGSTTSIFLRGMSSVNSAVFIDGVRAQTDRLGAFNFADIPLDMIDRVEIVRGNLGALYGEAAIGGAIHLFTRRGSGEPNGSASVTFGTQNTKSFSANYGGEVSDHRFQVDVSTVDTDGFSSRVGSGYNADSDGYRSRTINLRLSRRLSSMTELGAFVGAIIGESESDNLRANVEDTDHHLLKRNNDVFGVFLALTHGATARSRVEVLRSELKIEQLLNGVQRSFLTEGLSRGDQSTVRVSGEGTTASGTKLQGGAEVSSSDFLGVYYPASNGYAATRSDTRRDTRAIYAGAMHGINQWSIQTNFRRDTLEAQERGASEIVVSKSSWLLGVGYLLNDHLRMTASRATAFRAPAPDEFSSAPNIRPEQHRTNEFGLSYQTRLLSARLVRFQSESTDAIVYRSDTFDYQNINVENQGWEFNTNASTGRLAARLSLTAQDPRNITVENTRLARRARAYGAFDLTVNEGRFSYGGRLYSAGSRKDSDFNTVVLGPYTTLDLFWRLRLLPDWFLGARLENAGNTAYQLANTYATPPRSLFFSIQYKPRNG